MPSVRVEFTVRPEVADKIDEARGDVPRATWIKALIDRAIQPQPHVIIGGTVDGKDLARATTSAEAKRGVKPIPKGGK